MVILWPLEGQRNLNLRRYAYEININAPDEDSITAIVEILRRYDGNDARSCAARMLEALGENELHWAELEEDLSSGRLSEDLYDPKEPRDVRRLRLVYLLLNTYFTAITNKRHLEFAYESGFRHFSILNSEPCEYCAPHLKAIYQIADLPLVPLHVGCECIVMAVSDSP